MEKSTIKQQKLALSSLLEGYKKANELIMAEKKKRLKSLTEEDSFREYDALCRMWDACIKREGFEKLDEQKILSLVKRRKLFDKTGGFL